MRPNDSGPRKFKLHDGRARTIRPQAQRRRGITDPLPPGALVITVPALPIGNPVEVPER